MTNSSPATILFLAANPAALAQIGLAEECRTIEAMIHGAKFRSAIRFRSRWAARPDDLIQALNEDVPTVLHFSGHGAGEPGIYFQGDDAGPRLVSAEALAGVVRAAGERVALVVLNACLTEVQAKVLAQTVPCVVGMSEKIGDSDAIVYAGSFYRALAYGRSVANAHDQGLAALGLHSTDLDLRRDVNALLDADDTVERPLNQRIPQLLTRPEIDASRVHIVGDPRRSWMLASLLILAAAGTVLAIRQAQEHQASSGRGGVAPDPGVPLREAATSTPPIEAAREVSIDMPGAPPPVRPPLKPPVKPLEPMSEATRIVKMAKSKSCPSIGVALSRLPGADGNVLLLVCQCAHEEVPRSIHVARGPARELILDQDTRERLREAASSMACE